MLLRDSPCIAPLLRRQRNLHLVQFIHTDLLLVALIISVLLLMEFLLVLHLPVIVFVANLSDLLVCGM